MTTQEQIDQLRSHGANYPEPRAIELSIALMSDAADSIASLVAQLEEAQRVSRMMKEERDCLAHAVADTLNWGTMDPSHRQTLSDALEYRSK